MELALVLDPNADQSLQAQIFDQVRALILDCRLSAGMAMPASRTLAEQLSVSRNTVILAYDRLIAEGYIEARGTAGTFVSSFLPDGLMQISDGALPKNVHDEVDPEPVLCFAGAPGGDGKSSRPEIDFWAGRSAQESFPMRVWRKLLIRYLESSDVNLADYGDPAGLLELRQSIAEHLARTRGMMVGADQIVITGGSQDGLNLIHRLLDNNYKPFFVENPCYQGAALLFQSLGENVCPIPVDEAGLVVNDLPDDRSGVVFITPSHQFPIGVTLTLERRVQLLNWAKATDSVIIEDDYDSDFRYDGPPLTALAGLDNSRRVFYLGTFSKSLGAGLRLGFTVVPKSFAARSRQIKAYMNNGQPWLDQIVLAEFLHGGEFDRHLRRVRKIYKSRRDHLVECLKEYFPETTVSGEHCGLHLVWKIPQSFPPASDIQIEARSLGIGIYSLRSSAALDFNQNSEDSIFVIGYSSVPEADTTRAILRLRVLIDEMLQGDGLSDHKSNDDAAKNQSDQMQLSK
ncbi:MAG: PLP-dependent aminotransferase family protein [Hyphomicrobiaceae bacterium]